MRVRHLQSHLQDQQLIHHENISKLTGMRVGIDAVFWLRSIQALKDPFADAIGGIPPGILCLDNPLFVFTEQYDSL